jgi:lipid-A-disaccharide synthase
MRREGVELLAGLDDLAVMGFVEVVSHLPFFWKLERKVDASWTRVGWIWFSPSTTRGSTCGWRRRARERGIPVVFYIAPQVWAWKAHRAGRSWPGPRIASP